MASPYDLQQLAMDQKNDFLPSSYADALLPTSSSELAAGKAPIKGGSASLGASSLNLLNTTIGAGIVAMPYFFAQCGTVLGSVLLLVVSALSAYAGWMLFEASSKHPGEEWSYMGLARVACGTRGVALTQFSILVITIGVLSAYFVQMGETMADELSIIIGEGDAAGDFYVSATFVKLVATGAILIPLGMLRTLSGLSAASLIVMCVVALVVSVVCVVGIGQALSDDESSGGGDNATAGGDNATAGSDAVEVRAAFFGSAFFTAFPICVLAFGNQINMHTVVLEMHDPTPARVKLLLLLTNVTTSSIYLIIGIAGYFTFGDDTPDNVLLGDFIGTTSGEDDALTAARFGLVVAVLFSYPMLLFPCRACLDSVLRGVLPASAFDRVPERAVFVLETFFIIGLTFLISVVIPALGTILGYTGAVAGSLQGFILPALFHFQIIRTWQGAALLTFGVICMVVCFSAQVVVDAGA